MSPTDFENAIDGLELLLSECADRLLSEAFLYNAIKHGLSTIALDADTEIAQRPEGGGKSLATRARCSPTAQVAATGGQE